MKHKHKLKAFFLLILALFGLTSCATANKIPLAEGKPTLLFFYTEN